MDATPEETGRRMDALDLWGSLVPYNWAVKPLGTAFPYFCSVMPSDGKPVKVRFLMVEGWQTFHDYIRTRVDANFGFYSTPMEIPHFDLVVGSNGDVRLFRHDAGYAPRFLTDAERTLVGKILWEAFGVMMRIESDEKLPLRFADEKSMFARVETAPGVWEDAPLPIPDPQPYVERIAFPKALVAKAKDLPFDQKEALELDFRVMPNVVTNDPRPRLAYQLDAVSPETGERVMFDRVSVAPEISLKSLWEGMPQRVLLRLVERGRIPGEIRVRSGRVFRMLRALCMELPFKLSLHDRLPRLDALGDG